MMAAGRTSAFATPVILRISGLLVLLACLAHSPPALSVYSCGGEVNNCECGRSNFCICCECGNCVWWAWHEACCNWGRALPWCTNATDWDDRARANGYPMGNSPRDGCVFVCAAGAGCSDWGHV
ncbi:MAG: CHAP domain-containing protein, partial [Pseudomonadota bacterium]